MLHNALYLKSKQNKKRGYKMNNTLFELIESQYNEIKGICERKQEILTAAIEEYKRVNKIKGLEFMDRLQALINNYNETRANEIEEIDYSKYIK